MAEDWRPHNPIRSLQNELRDNTFKTARNLGSLQNSSTPITLKASGRVDKADRVDLFKLAFPSGAEITSTNSVIRVKRGKIKVSGYIQTFIDPRPILLESRTFSSGVLTFSDDSNYSNTTPGTNYFYLKVERLRGKVKYTIKTTYTTG